MTLLDTIHNPDSDNLLIRFHSWTLVSNSDLHFYLEHFVLALLCQPEWCNLPIRCIGLMHLKFATRLKSKVFSLERL